MPARLPLTFQQEWLCEVIRANENWQVAAARAFRLSGLLNVPLLQQCLHEVIRRHDALRTRIATYDGVVSQEVLEPQEYLLERIVIRGSSMSQVTANARRYVEELCDRRMDLSAEPLWNARLLELNEREHWLVFAMHRLIGDCVSIEQVYREIKSLYGAWLQGLSVMPAQYADYTRWQQQTCVEWVKRHEPYWQRHLADAAPVQWPIDTDPTVTTPGILGKVQCAFGMELRADLLDLARKVRTLPAVPMMAIYAAVLWRWCHQSDFVLPLNTTGRPTAYKSAIGYFSYALYVRVHIAGEETFKDLVSRIGNEFFSSLSHPDFGRIARQRPDLLSGTLFQWVTWYPEESPEERVCIREFGEGMTVVPPGMTALEVTVFETETGLHAFGSYRADCFRAKTMQQFMVDLRWAAELFVRNPDARIAAVAEVGGNVHGTAERAARDAGMAQCH